MELILGATRALQLLLSILIIGLSSGAISSILNTNSIPLTKTTYPALGDGTSPPNRFALFTGLFEFLTLLFLITSQFLFVHRYNGYSTYINIALVLETVNWVFSFGAWVALAQFGASGTCSGGVREWVTTCGIDRALLGFLVLMWVCWSVSAVVMIRLKVSEEKDEKAGRDIEMRIKEAVAMQSGARAQAARVEQQQEGDENVEK